MYYCEQPSCTQAVWETVIDSASCGAHIEWVRDNAGDWGEAGLGLLGACGYVAAQESTSAGCAACEPVYCEQPSCTQAVWNTVVDGYTCGSHIEWVRDNAGDWGDALGLVGACAYIAAQPSTSAPLRRPEHPLSR